MRGKGRELSLRAQVGIAFVAASIAAVSVLVFSAAGLAAAVALIHQYLAAAHPEWLPAVICAAAYALLLRQTRSLFACFLAHAVTNLCLGTYIIATGTWSLW